MIEQPVSSSRTTTPSFRRIVTIGLLVVLLLLLGLVLYKGVTLAWAGWKTYQSAMQMRALVTTTSLDNPAALQSSLDRLAADYGQLADGIEPLLPVVERLGFLPDYGELAKSSPELLEASRQGMLLAQQSARIFMPALAELRTAQPDASTRELLPQVLVAKAADLPALRPGMESLGNALSKVDSALLPDRLAAPLQAAPDLLALADVAAQLGPELPALLGMDGPKTYLILVQNNHELRATGGFIAAIGRLTVDKGKLTEMDFADSYSVYRNDGTYPPAPAAMQQYMNIPLLVMRDANWSPDLPTAAQVAQALYKSDVGVEVNGIVTVDLNAVKQIFDALGEVQVPGFDTPITGDNIEDQMVQLWERPADSDASVDNPQAFKEWWSQRKDFIPKLADAALAKVQGGSADYLALVSAARKTLNDRSIQVWLDNAEAEEILSAQGWDGALHPQEGHDFLAVVDTNMGYNKVDAAMQRALDYRVSWPDGAAQPAQATLTLTYTHPIDAEDPGCDLTPRYGGSYADMIARCYFDYVRVYVPAGSKLIEATGVDPDSVSTQRGERRTQIFTGYFILPPHNTHVVKITYTLPKNLSPDDYQLTLQRQSGTQPLPVTVTVADETRSTVVEDAIFEWPETAPGP